MKFQLRPTVTHTRQNRSRLHNNLPLPFLGRGAYGSVDVVQQCYTGQVFARKRSRITSFHREVEITKRLKHPHIIQFVAAYTQNSSLNLIISPVAESTLRDYLDCPGGQEGSESRIHRWVGCLSSALSYIHASRIRHADIKPQNILLRDSEVFISDFGISRLVSEPDSTSSSNSPMTPLYAAIEIAEHLPHGRSADVFSLGCVFAEMLTAAQGKIIMDFHDYLGISTTSDNSGKPAAYYRKHDRLMSWILQLRQRASASAQRLWDICALMLQDTAKLRPSSSSLVTQVREVLQKDLNIVPECISSPLASEVCRSLVSCHLTSFRGEVDDACSSSKIVPFPDSRLLKSKYPHECQPLFISTPSEPLQKCVLDCKPGELGPSEKVSKLPSSPSPLDSLSGHKRSYLQNPCALPDIWTCCNCGDANFIPTADGHCPLCGHKMCMSCGPSGSYTLKASASSVAPPASDSTPIQEIPSWDSTHHLFITTIISQNSLKIWLTITGCVTVIIASGPVLVLEGQVTGHSYHGSTNTSSKIQV